VNSPDSGSAPPRGLYFLVRRDFDAGLSRHTAAMFFPLRANPATGATHRQGFGPAQ
jgi:hypothetical protein